MNKGYIRLYRQLQDCWIWIDEESPEKFTRGSAWIDLLLFANHKDKKIRYEDGFRIIKRGQFLTSKRKLAERWMWNRRTVDKFLDLLVKDEMITIECTTKHTLITIVNYSIYQGDESENEPQDTPPTTPQDAPQDAPRSTPRSTPRSSTNNNDNNERSIKEKEIPKGISKKKNFAPPTLEEVKAYCEERKNGIDAQYFIDYYTANGWTQGKGKPIKNWQAAVRTWERNNSKKGVRTDEGSNGRDAEPPVEFTEEQLRAAEEYLSGVQRGGLFN